MNTMLVIVYDCILNYVTACDCIHSFPSFPVVHKAKMPTLGMLMLDQKTSKKELGGFDHPGQAQRYETWVFNKNVQKDGKVNRCSFGSRIWLSLSHCVHLTGSFSYQLKQEVVKGLTLDICHSGKLTPELEKSFTSSISALEVPRSKNTDTPWSRMGVAFSLVLRWNFSLQLRQQELRWSVETRVSWCGFNPWRGKAPSYQWLSADVGGKGM